MLSPEIQYRAKHGLLYAGTNTEQIRRILQNRLGHYTANQGKVATLNKRLAAELAGHVAEAQQERLLRPKVSTGRLHEALLDPKNREADRFGFGVGKPKFLATSTAKYWRQIDRGYGGHVGRNIFGIWGSKVSGVVTPGGAYGPYDRAIGPFSAHGQATGQRFRPYGGLDARNKRLQATKIGWSWIRRPIEPQHYFERGWKAFDPHHAAQRILKEMGLKS
jgi:hypothetical protein